MANQTGLSLFPSPGHLLYWTYRPTSRSQSLFIFIILFFTRLGLSLIANSLTFHRHHFFIYLDLPSTVSSFHFILLFIWTYLRLLVLQIFIWAYLQLPILFIFHLGLPPIFQFFLFFISTYLQLPVLFIFHL